MSTNAIERQIRTAHAFNRRAVRIRENNLEDEPSMDYSVCRKLAFDARKQARHTEETDD